MNIFLIYREQFQFFILSVLSAFFFYIFLIIGSTNDASCSLCFLYIFLYCCRDILFFKLHCSLFFKSVLSTVLSLPFFIVVWIIINLAWFNCSSIHLSISCLMLWLDFSINFLQFCVVNESAPAKSSIHYIAIWMLLISVLLLIATYLALSQKQSFFQL